MLRLTKELINYDVKAFDDQIGKVDDFLFMDTDFIIQYMVVNTGPLFLGRNVLISPSTLGEPDWISKQIPVNLTKQEIKDSPDIKTDQPISAIDLERLHDYYRWPKFWTPFNTALNSTNTRSSSNKRAVTPEQRTDTVKLSLQKVKEIDTPKLRSVNEVIGYEIAANDGTAGTIDDIIIDDKLWFLRYLVIKTGNIFNHKKVVLAVDWIDWISHRKSEFRIDMPIQTIKESPEFDPETPMTRRQEEVFYDFHGKPYYWVKR
jgi:hypothetical protein